MMKQTRRSAVWSQFKLVNDDKDAKCTICGSFLNYNNSTKYDTFSRATWSKWIGFTAYNHHSVGTDEAAGFLFPYAAVVIAAASFLFLVAMSVCFFLLFKMPASQGVTTGTSDADEVMYADVKIQMGQRKREVHHCTETVEYGQVRVHQQSHD
ncbi:hypothetical protein ABVT39_009934 [Epinephelus coioides]